MTNIKENNNLYQRDIPKSKRLKGDVSHKKELKIDERTTIYVDPGLTEAELELKRQIYLNNRAKYADL